MGHLSTACVLVENEVSRSEAASCLLSIQPEEFPQTAFSKYRWFVETPRVLSSQVLEIV